MADPLELIAGTEVGCTDGGVGHVRGLIFDPLGRTVTHLSVCTRSPNQPGRLVPLEKVQSGGAAVELSCDRDRSYTFPANEELAMAPQSQRGGRPAGAPGPHGEKELEEDENVYASDGRAGHLVGAVVEGDSPAARGLLVRVGHFSGRHQVSVPIDAVTAIDKRGIHLSVAKDELSADSGLT